MFWGYFPLELQLSESCNVPFIWQHYVHECVLLFFRRLSVNSYLLNNIFIRCRLWSLGFGLLVSYETEKVVNRIAEAEFTRVILGKQRQN